MTHAQRIARFAAADLYVVITEACCGGRPAESILEACLEAGVRLIQFREKEGTARELLTRADRFRRLTDTAGALLIIDDRLDLALACGADGVHLGQEDLPMDRARRLAPELLLGASTHTPQQARAAQDAGASYLNLGPIFPTQTKAAAVPPLGPEYIRQNAPHLRIPFTVMGGINTQNIAQVLEAGARICAVVTAVTQAPDPAAAARTLRRQILAQRK